MQLQLDRFTTPIGELLLVFDDAGLRALDFADFADRMYRLLRLHYGEVTLAEAAAPATITAPLAAYFAGDLGALDTVKVATGGTEFQRQVWAALRAIPAGATASYGELAARVGRPKASRAIGMANGSNPSALSSPATASSAPTAR